MVTSMVNTRYLIFDWRPASRCFEIWGHSCVADVTVFAATVGCVRCEIADEGNSAQFGRTRAGSAGCGGRERGQPPAGTALLCGEQQWLVKVGSLWSNETAFYNPQAFRILKEVSLRPAVLLLSFPRPNERTIGQYMSAMWRVP